MDGGGDWRYPAEGFLGTGSIQGGAVSCLTPDVQMLDHAGGYLPGDTDFHDMALLHERFGTTLLPPYDRPREPYYRADLARIHHLGFGFHALDCAPGILAHLKPVLARHGVVVELGCGSGLLTRHLIDAGHRVIASDASPAMLDLARELAPDALEIRRITLPDDPIPDADAIVSVGHVLSYLPDAGAIDRALVAIARALRPGGQMAIDLCDLRYAEARSDLSTRSWVEDDWALITHFEAPTPDRFVRRMTMFTRSEDGSWRRDEERHDNALIDTSRVPALLAAEGVSVRIGTSFGDEELPEGLHTIVGAKTA
jgi:SAM-dependent methyltransferase